jgi:hypothetical protein
LSLRFIDDALHEQRPTMLNIVPDAVFRRCAYILAQGVGQLTESTSEPTRFRAEFSSPHLPQPQAHSSEFNKKFVMRLQLLNTLMIPKETPYSLIRDPYG